MPFKSRQSLQSVCHVLPILQIPSLPAVLRDTHILSCCPEEESSGVADGKLHNFLNLH
jgi:hypothetical protein